MMGKTRVFDLFGTLVNLERPQSGLEHVLCPSAASQLGDRWRSKQLELAWVAEMTGNYETFWDITVRALDIALDGLEIGDDPHLKSILLATYSEASVYPDVAPALKALRAEGDTLVVLSNGNSRMLCDALIAAGLSSVFDRVLSTESARVFKPAPEAYALAERSLGVAGRDIHFYSSNAWDVFGATSFGWRTTWVNRQATAFGYPTLPTDGAIRALDALYERVRTEPQAASVEPAPW